MNGLHQTGRAAISIVVDDRETRAPVLAALRAMDEFNVDIRRLTVGDYRVDNRFLVERKTLTDLVASIKSGRLFAQALRLAEVPKLTPALVLEGTTRDLRGSGMRRETVQGALVTAALFIGLPILRTRSPAETAHTLLSIGRQAEAIKQDALPRRGKRPKNKRALQLYLLQGLPGVGPTRATQLLERYGSVRAVLDAQPAELTAVHGIGKTTARRIGWAVEDQRADYAVGFRASPTPC